MSRRNQGNRSFGAALLWVLSIAVLLIGLSESDVGAETSPTQSGVNSAWRGRIISVDVAETDFDNFLRIIAEVSNMNVIVIGAEVHKKVTRRAINEPWDSILASVLDGVGLQSVTAGNVIKVYRKTDTTLSQFTQGRRFAGSIISLDLKDTGFDNALQILRETSGRTITGPEAVSCKITLRIIDVPWDQALGIIFELCGFESREVGDGIHFFKP